MLYTSFLHRTFIHTSASERCIEHPVPSYSRFYIGESTKVGFFTSFYPINMRSKFFSTQLIACLVICRPDPCSIKFLSKSEVVEFFSIFFRKGYHPLLLFLGKNINFLQFKKAVR